MLPCRKQVSSSINFGWGAHSIHITNKLKLASYFAMAANVFGTPITDNALTTLGRAKLANNYINADGKDANAKHFVKKLMSRYGTGIKTGGLFYNATGGPLTLVNSHDYHGHVYEVSYPTAFQNGQWIAFLHVRGSIFVGSSAAVVYRSVNDQGDRYDYMCSWSVPVSGDNKVHTYTITNCLNTHAYVHMHTHSSFSSILLLEILT